GQSCSCAAAPNSSRMRTSLACRLPLARNPKWRMRLEAVWQNVKEKASHELGGRQGHGLDARSVSVVFPGESHVVIGNLYQAMIGDGDAVRVAAQIAENLLRPGKGLLAVDHPVDPPERGKAGTKCSRLRQIGEIGEELQASVLMSGNKLLQKGARNRVERTR